MRRQNAAAHLAELEPNRLDSTLAHGERRDGKSVRRVVIDERACFDHFLRARIIGLESLASERPAGVRKPVALFEVDLLQRPAPPAPMVGAAAEEAHPRS